MKDVVAPAGTHTHTAPPRPVTKAPPCTLGGEGGCLGHDTVIGSGKLTRPAP